MSSVTRDLVGYVSYAAVKIIDSIMKVTTIAVLAGIVAAVFSPVVVFLEVLLS